MRVWAHRVLGALGWVALVLLAVWRLPEVARTACSIVVDDPRGDIERMGAADTLMILADHRSVPALRQAYSTSKWPGLRIRVLGALTRPLVSARGQLATNSGLILLWKPPLSGNRSFRVPCVNEHMFVSSAYEPQRRDSDPAQGLELLDELLVACRAVLLAADG